jgi:hypothetical protein
MTLAQIHWGLARASVIFSLVIGLYSLWYFVRQQKIGESFWGTLVVGELLYLAQGAVGMLLYLGGRGAALPRPAVHILYGILLVIVLPGAYAYTRGQDDRRTALAYGLAGLFLAGVALRAITTA